MGCCCCRTQSPDAEPLISRSPDSSRSVSPTNEPALEAGTSGSLLGFLSEEEIQRLVQRLGMLQRLPIVLYEKDTHIDPRECTICMGDYRVGSEVRFLPCLHSFHRACIDDWLIKTPACPICWQRILPDDRATSP
eukprot:m.13474 g.13474  ORF g.13474 m.13474 type:complete len:135 (+) comp2831_c0_seq2:16-420(+)